MINPPNATSGRLPTVEGLSLVIAPLRQSGGAVDLGRVVAERDDGAVFAAGVLPWRVTVTLDGDVGEVMAGEEVGELIVEVPPGLVPSLSTDDALYQLSTTLSSTVADVRVPAVPRSTGGVGARTAASGSARSGNSPPTRLRPNPNEFKKNPDVYPGSIREAAQLVRVALTGSTRSPDLHVVATTLGPTEVQRRLARHRILTGRAD